ncbi:hypothetical protein BSL78_03598 [Apostichopus japonicus]|uniref:Uncharacterized protein n=1 Tax=Stichopus japonicus TaxID=307972 RepID=A0A2G8LH07_STIJA|nr:hypothetical protein BSL78_03598 [Apostichopus japonicus]
MSKVYCLHCYHCGSAPDDPCNESKSLVHCPKKMDSCSLEAMWFGDLDSEMTLVRSCLPSTECPDVSAQNGNSYCVRTQKGLTCSMCCSEDGCNNGGNGGILRPPPKPPVPQTLVNRLLSTCTDIGTDCETTVTWADFPDQRLQVRKECMKESDSLDHSRLTPYSTSKSQCNVKSDDTFCVGCCAGDDCSHSTCNKFNIVTMSLSIIISVITMHWRIWE